MSLEDDLRNTNLRIVRVTAEIEEQFHLLSWIAQLALGNNNTRLSACNEVLLLGEQEVVVVTVLCQLEHALEGCIRLYDREEIVLLVGISDAEICCERYLSLPALECCRWQADRDYATVNGHCRISNLCPSWCIVAGSQLRIS